MTKMMRCKSCHTLHKEYSMYEGLCSDCMEWSDLGRDARFHWFNIVAGFVVAVIIYLTVKGIFW